jgi:hypothetical protein
LDGAFLANARGIAVVEKLDDHFLPLQTERMSRLAGIYASLPWDPI